MRLLASAALLLIVALTAAGAATAAQDAANARAKGAAALVAEVGQLRAKISSLEPRIADQTLLLKTKNDAIETLKNVIEAEMKKMSTLQSEITAVKAKGSLAAEEQASKANARATELEKQIEKLKKNTEAQNNKKAALEARAGDAEKKVQELNVKLEKLQRTSDEQKRRIQKTENALKSAEEELLKVQLETTTKLKQLREVHGALLPPWLAAHASESLEVMSNHWNKHGKPIVNSLLQKASEISVAAKKWAKPHVETAKTEAKKRSKPYIDQVATATKPYVEKIRTALKPYIKSTVHLYGEKASTYHQQAQATILDYLRQHEFTKEFATEEMVWYLALALLVTPVLVVYTLLVEALCTKKQKKAPSGNANHGHGRHKRRHADKQTIDKLF